MVNQGKLTPIQGSEQGGAQRQVALHALTDVLGEKSVGVASVLFGLIHGRVGGAKQGLLVLTVFGVTGDTNAGTGEDFPPVNIDGLVEHAQDLGRQIQYIVPPVDFTHQHQELVSPQTTYRIRGANHLLQSVRYGDQKPVSGDMAEAIVYMLEVVQVQEHEGDPGTGALGAKQSLVDPVCSQAPVGQAGEFIEIGMLCQAHFH